MLFLRKINLSSIVYSGCFLLLLLNQITIDNGISIPLEYTDEIFSIIFLLYIIIHSKEIYTDSIFISFIFFMLCGLVGSLIWRTQTFIAIIRDCFVCSKFMIAYLFGCAFFKKKVFFVDKIISCAKFMTILFSILGTLQFFSEHSVGFPLFFSHITYLTHASVILMLIFTYHFYKTDRGFIYLILCSFLIVYAFTSKGLGFLFIYWIGYILLFKIRVRHKFIAAFFAICFALLLSFGEIQNYFFTNSYSPRFILLSDSIKILLNLFPTGLGFGTFASAAAYEFYSSIYYYLRYDHNYGMGPDLTVNFMCDSFWPCIFAQFGFIGLICFLYIVYRFLVSANRIFNINRHNGYILFLIIAYLLIVSTAETSFFGQESILLFLLFSYIKCTTIQPLLR